MYDGIDRIGILMDNMIYDRWIHNFYTFCNFVWCTRFYFNIPFKTNGFLFVCRTRISWAAWRCLMKRWLVLETVIIFFYLLFYVLFSNKTYNTSFFHHKMSIYVPILCSEWWWWWWCCYWYTHTLPCGGKRKSSMQWLIVAAIPIPRNHKLTLR